MDTKVKKVVQHEVKRVKKDAVQAAQSGTFLYPFQGILYFTTHEALWKPLAEKLAPSVALGFGITVAMFVFAYAPQMGVMAFTQGPLAAVSAALLVLSESATLFTILSKTLLVEEALADTFDGTLVARGDAALVQKGRELQPHDDPIGKLGRLLKHPFPRFTSQHFIRYILYLPLNFIPVVGTVMFVVLQGSQYGPHAHARYFQLKEWSQPQIDKHVKSLQGAYTGFGTVAVLLEMIPVVSGLFAFTNTVGAALWAADLEKKDVSINFAVSSQPLEVDEKTE